MHRMNINIKQAGAELYQAQVKLLIAQAICYPKKNIERYREPGEKTKTHMWIWSSPPLPPSSGLFCQLPLLQTLNPTLINVTNNSKPLHKTNCTTPTVP